MSVTDNHLVHTDSNEIAFSDPVNGSVKLSEVSAIGHHDFDDLVHNISESNYMEITRSSGKLQKVTYWTSSGKTKKIREITVYRSSGKINIIHTGQFDSSGYWKHTV